MFKKYFSKKKITVYLFSIFYFHLFTSSVFSQEQLTITTYYPSPFGSYSELSTNRFRVGAGVMPDNDGVVNFQQLAANPGGVNSNTEGSLYYNNVAHEFRYRDNTGWRSLGNPCLRRVYDSSTGVISCPAGYQLAGVVYADVADGDGSRENPLPTTGQYLCCLFCNDFNFDGNCD